MPKRTERRGSGRKGRRRRMKFEVPGYSICECVIMLWAQENFCRNLQYHAEDWSRAEALVPTRGNHDWRYQAAAVAVVTVFHLHVSVRHRNCSHFWLVHFQEAISCSSRFWLCPFKGSWGSWGTFRHPVVKPHYGSQLRSHFWAPSKDFTGLWVSTCSWEQWSQVASWLCKLQTCKRLWD
jgi:hypothetical protein